MAGARIWRTAMNPLNPLLCVPVLGVALATVWLLTRRIPVPSVGRFVSVDGLRGYLAFFVFLHHAALWYFYLRTGAWRVPPSRLFTHFGQISVALFFMITSFLFLSKVLDARAKPIDWTRLYVSRVLRLAPLYLFTMLALALVVAQLSQFSLHEPAVRLLAGAARWLTFTIVGGPPLNGVAETSDIVAGVTWSLPYEWFFYFSLPLLALLLRVVPPVPCLLLSVVSLAVFSLLKPAVPHLLAFTGGMAAAVAIRRPAIARYSQGSVAASLAIACVIVAALLPVSDRIDVRALPLLTLAFCIIAAGNDLFGVLGAPLSRHFGEMSYSIYLLHGLLLFVTFRFVVGLERAAELSPVAHWTAVLCCSPLLILVCHTTYRFIELPPNRSVPAVTAWLEARFARRRPVKPLPT